MNLYSSWLYHWCPWKIFVKCPTCVVFESWWYHRCSWNIYFVPLVLSLKGVSAFTFRALRGCVTLSTISEQHKYSEILLNANSIKKLCFCRIYNIAKCQSYISKVYLRKTFFILKVEPITTKIHSGTEYTSYWLIKAKQSHSQTIGPMKAPIAVAWTWLVVLQLSVAIIAN